MSEYYKCPNCGEDCIEIEFLMKKDCEGVNIYRFVCPHCTKDLIADLSLVPIWFINLSEGR